MSEKQIEINDVSFSYDEDGEMQNQLVLKHIKASVKAGEFVAILGHNGSGKSTLAKLINALYLPTEGEVIVCGMDTRNDERLWDIRSRAGMIFQNPDNQIVATVVREDVAFGLENMGVPTEEMIPRIESALSAVHMQEYAGKAPHMLSGGQKQRVAIAGVLAMEPNILVADEATAMLDPSGRKEVLETVHRLNTQKGITVLWITHYMEEAATADRVIVISDGHVVMEGKPREVFNQVEKMKEEHLDVPPMTALANELRKEGMPLPDGILTVDEMLEEVEKLLCPLS